jgi:hypothetical protein
MSDWKDKGIALMESLKRELEGKTIQKVEFEDLERFGTKDLRITLSDGNVFLLSASSEFDRCGDFEGTRLYVTIEDPDGKFSLDAFFQ